jgi:hypothetical protein
MVAEIIFERKVKLKQQQRSVHYNMYYEAVSPLVAYHKMQSKPYCEVRVCSTCNYSENYSLGLPEQLSLTIELSRPKPYFRHKNK